MKVNFKFIFIFILLEKIDNFFQINAKTINAIYFDNNII